MVLAVLLAIICWITYSGVSSFAQPYISSTMDDLPAQKVGLMLGTSPRLSGGRPNLYFTYRVQAATDLYEQGKIEYILVSGDNRKKEYNEPRAMRDALIKKGISEDHIILDYAGFRTFDSMIRAEKVFGQDSFIVISQPFHNERAVFIARKSGIEAYGFNARDVDVAAGFKTKLREVGARVKMILDIYVLHTEPKFLGDPVIIP
ncbi:MAG TPA: protein SanA [Cryomorphaceae bacterium]|nr:protein SanA [Owenweeksia sp.]HAD97039.1 protein SanA [Cryomorphaceae bacterium]HBF21528.1 protein SanA [Cryomorphaceae bacterium]|tara:strand:+ start:309 stop:920 length:612 start_codon:yes stop_codon:yes gene_type:complete